MMVTFISQCEKKALKRTRRILDAFASRIGDNAWQTVITEDGLTTVRKMLRQTASKNTAVSCHWIRSRSRSQFLWVVGNKKKFNKQGIVAVNYTNIDDIKTDHLKMNCHTPLANTQKQLLASHLFAVGQIAYTVVSQLTEDEQLAKTACYAGYLHDIGKLDPVFQGWVSKAAGKNKGAQTPENGCHIDAPAKFSFEKYPRHNEVSWALLRALGDGNDFSLANRKQFNFLQHAVFWHHAKPIRRNREDFSVFGAIQEKLESGIKGGFGGFLREIVGLIKQINQIAADYGFPIGLPSAYKSRDAEFLAGLSRERTPEYKGYTGTSDDMKKYTQDARQNARADVVRAALIAADRAVSALSAEQLQDRVRERALGELADSMLTVKPGLAKAIDNCLQGFAEARPDSQRNKDQNKAAKALSEVEKIAVLSGPAGVGKTKIALEWAQKTDARQIIWVCPRVQVCQGLYKDLTAAQYLPDSKIELCTGEFKLLSQSGRERELADDERFSGDIVLTTIDQALGATTTHTKATGLIGYLNAHVVFDEYHEYIQMPGINLLFAELIECKKSQRAPNTLLVSATPNYVFVEDLLDIDRNDVVDVPTFNRSLYQFEFAPFDEETDIDSHPLSQPAPENTFVISNTAVAAQQAFIANQGGENALLFHGRFKTADKKEIFDRIFDNFKQGGARAFDVLRCGPIAQAALNVSCDHMVTEFTMAENWLQRLGRLDRFGERKTANTLVTALPAHIDGGKGDSSCAKWLSRLRALESAKAWRQFLRDNLPDGAITLERVYQLYRDFYQNPAMRERVAQDLLASLKDGARQINAKAHDPIRHVKKPRPDDIGRRLKKSSLRGDSRYVQLARCRIGRGGALEHLGEYACDGEENVLTLPMGEIEGYDVSDNNLAEHMRKQHPKIMRLKTQKDCKRERNCFILMDKAVEPENPVYLSYTQADLGLTGDRPHSHAIYYVEGENQPIGAMRADKLNQPEKRGNHHGKSDRR